MHFKFSDLAIDFYEIVGNLIYMDFAHLQSRALFELLKPVYT